MFVGPETLSLPDFAPTIADAILTHGDTVQISRGNVQFESTFATTPSNRSDGRSTPMVLLPRNSWNLAACRVGRSNRLSYKRTFDASVCFSIL